MTPLAACWPMGSSWASHIAQSVMTGRLIRAGVKPNQLMHANAGLPPRDAAAFSVATDDVIAFERGVVDADYDGTKCQGIDRLEAVWKEIELVAKSEKSLDRSLNGAALGLNLVDGKHLLPKHSRLRDVVSGLFTLLSKRVASPAGMSHFFGVVQWLLLAYWPMLSCCGSIYGFLDEDDNVTKRIPIPATRDLVLITCLLPGLCIDLRAEWTPFFSATDGAQDFGYGGVIAACDPIVTRELASLSRGPQYPFLLSDAKRIEGESANVLGFAMSDFKVQFSVRASSRDHASKLEMGALCLMLQNLVRTRRWHRSRTFNLVDSQALMFAIRKGRSSSANFRQGARRAAAMMIAGEIHLHLGFTPSRSNPADPPSRGKQLASKVCAGRHEFMSPAAVRLKSTLHKHKRAHRRIVKCGTGPSWWSLGSWSSSCSSSGLAQPSERSTS